MWFRYSIISIFFMSSVAFAEGSDRLDQDYKRKEQDSRKWVLLNRSHVSDIAYSKNSDVNYFFDKPANFKYLHVKLGCAGVTIRSVQTFDKTSPVQSQLTAKGIYRVDGTIDRLRVSLYQNKSKNMSCLTELYGVQDIPEVRNIFPDSSDVAVELGRVVVGGYNGNEKEINTHGLFIKSVYVSFSGSGCEDLFLAEVGTFSAKFYDVTEPSDAENLFLINEGQGLRVNSVRLNFVGKTYDECVGTVYGSVKNFVRANFP